MLTSQNLKKCNKCGEEKPLDCFYSCRGKSSSPCKECVKDKQKRYYQEHKAEYHEYILKYYQQNKEQIKNQVKEYASRLESKLRSHEVKKTYRDNHKEKTRNDNNKWRLLHKERMRIQARESYYRNREKILFRSNEKIRNDPRLKIARSMSGSIWQALKQNKNGNHWESLVGYTVDDLKNHLESLFIDGMSWDNYGKWHIDHIIPKSAFNYTSNTHIDFKRCWALSNLRPMWAEDNLRKHHKIDKHFQPCLPISIKENVVAFTV